MFRGGYKIIDLRGHTFPLATGVVVPGVYEAIESTLKTLVLERLSYTTAGETTRELPATAVTFTLSGTDFVAIIDPIIDGDTLSAYSITVDDSDTVTIAHITKNFATESTEEDSGTSEATE